MHPGERCAQQTKQSAFWIKCGSAPWLFEGAKRENGMKHLLIVVAVVIGLIVGCTSKTVEESQQPAGSGGVPEIDQTPVATDNIITATPSSSPAASPVSTTSPPTTTATSTPLASSTAKLAPNSTPPAVPTTGSGEGKLAIEVFTPTAVAQSGGDAEPVVLTEHGLEIYRKLYCGICHQLAAAGTRGLFGPTHDGMALTAEQRIQDPEYTGAAITAAEYLRESIVNPGFYLVEGYEHANQPMPAYNTLDETDLNALVQFLLRQE
jgi:mono/diheme cytochrome c family protein